MRFADYGKRVVFAAFDGGEITSDAGVLLLRERARRIRLFERMAGCFTDHRDRERLTHTLPALLAQRVCGMALGYEDIIDHDTLRFDPALKLLASPGTEYPGTPAPLAGKSTLSRLEQSWETGTRRYHQMVPNLKSLSNLFVALFLDACDTPPARITLDIDATDVETHGRQENAVFHGYYEHRCFLPLYVFCGRHLLLAQLRPANIDGARGARNQIRRIVAMIRERWPNVAIVLRGDSGFARENLMRWCEGNAVDYVFGLARNDVLLKKAQRVRGKAAMAMIETGQPVRAYGDFHHITKSRTWARPRRVIAKVEHKPGHEQRCRFLVTSLDRHQVPPRELYEDTYCPRGDMENRIKDCQLDLFANRMSAHAYKANQLRLLLAAFAYVLIDGIRRVALKKTTLAKGAVDAAMAMASPVQGLRPWRVGRLFVVNVPKPAMETGSPLARLSPTAAKTAATIRSAEILSRMSWAASCALSSVRFMSCFPGSAIGHAGPGGWRSGTRRASRYFRRSPMATASAPGRVWAKPVDLQPSHCCKEGRVEWRDAASCLQRTCQGCRGRSDGSLPGQWMRT